MASSHSNQEMPSQGEVSLGISKRSGVSDLGEPLLVSKTESQLMIQSAVFITLKKVVLLEKSYFKQYAIGSTRNLVLMFVRLPISVLIIRNKLPTSLLPLTRVTPPASNNTSRVQTVLHCSRSGQWQAPFPTSPSYPSTASEGTYYPQLVMR